MISEDHRKTFTTYSMKQKLAIPSLANINISLIVLTLCIIGTTYHLNSLYKNSLIGHNAAHYISVAKNFFDGKGFSTSIIYYTENQLSGEVPAPQTVFPIGYPFLISLVMQLGVSPSYSAYLICILCFNIIGIELFYIASKLNYSNNIKLFIIACWFFLISNWSLVLSCMSEMCFIFFTTTSVLFLLINEINNKKQFVLYSSIAAALSFTIRYVGIFLILSLILYFVYKCFIKKERFSITNLFLFSFVPIITVITIFSRNYLIVGSIRGSSRHLTEQSFTDAILSIYSAFCSLSGFSKSRFIAFDLPSILIFIAAFIFVSLLILYTKKHVHNINSQNDTPSLPFIKFVFIYVIVSILFLIYFNIASIEPLETRYIVPLIPMFTIIIANMFHSLRKYKYLNSKIISTCIYIIIIAFLFGQTNVYASLEKTITYNNYDKIYDAIKGSGSSAKLRLFISEIIKRKKLLLGNHPEVLENILNIPVIGLSNRSFNQHEWPLTEVVKIIKKYKIDYVLFFPRLFIGSKDDHIFFYSLKNNKIPHWLKERYKDDSVILFEVDKTTM